jgi:hypothetical protein
MAALEQEPIVFTGVPIGTTETVVGNIPVPGAGLDTPLSAVSQKACPFKAIRVRGIIIVTATVSYFTAIKLRQGNGNIVSNQVQATIAPAVPTTGIVGFSVPFEFVDLAPIGLWYSLTAIANVANTSLAIASITGWDG